MPLVDLTQGAMSLEMKSPRPESTSRKSLRVSVIINNFNYAQFLPMAIESALSQTYANTEVVVVDDGSTDDSRHVISQYANRVIVVLKENGGQSSSLNAGFAKCSGNIVIFLDADDELLPDTAENVVAAFDANPSLSKVQFRLTLVDQDGNEIGGSTPPSRVPMPNGNIQDRMLRFPHDVCFPPMSGNAFAASMLSQILPMPESRIHPTGADHYLLDLSPLYGPIASLPLPGGRYRVHDRNHHFTSKFKIETVRRTINRNVINNELIVRHARQIGLSGIPARSEDVVSVTLLAHRLISLKLEPEEHPIRDDSMLRLTWLGVRTSASRYDLSLRTRAVFMLWFVATACGPSRLATWLFETAFFPDHATKFTQFIHGITRKSSDAMPRSAE